MIGRKLCSNLTVRDSSKAFYADEIVKEKNELRYYAIENVAFRGYSYKKV